MAMAASSSLQAEQLDKKDKELLNEIQWSFPLAQRPFLEISKRHKLSEEEVIHRIARLKDIGLIRQINRNPGVSHNYERNHEYNMWFTLAVPPNENMRAVLDRMAPLDGVLKYRL